MSIKLNQMKKKTDNTKMKSVLKGVITSQRLEKLVGELKEVKTSVFTKDDVLKLLNEVNKDIIPSDDEVPSIKELAEEIASEIVYSGGKDIVNDYTLSMTSNEVELDDVELDENAIEDIVTNVLENYFK